MKLRPFSIVSSDASSPLIISSPHSGREYPEDFGFSCSLPDLRRAEDAYVDELIIDAADAGTTVICAEFPRSYIDLNRAEDDLDPAVLAEEWPHPLNPSPRTLQGLGLVRRLCRNGVPVYASPLSVAAVQKRIETCYRPYHNAIEKLLTERRNAFGEAYMIDCHSMPGAPLPGGAGCQPDFVLGDRDGMSSDPSFTCLVARLLRERGYRVAVNHPYKGVEILRLHGKPYRGIHAVQLEIDRGLYMNEETLERNHGFETLRGELKNLFQRLNERLAENLEHAAAAE